MRLGAYAAACTRTSRVQLHDDRNFYNPTTSHSLLPQHARLGPFLLYTDIQTLTSNLKMASGSVLVTG
jgi:hypothetical protein